MLVDQKAVLIGANKQGHVIDYDGVVAYGAGSTVALWDPLAPLKKGVYQTLNAHTKEVTCVRFLSSGLLVSAAEDGRLCVWQRSGAVFSLRVKTEETTYSITTLCAVDDNLFLAGDSSGCITLWRVSEDSEGLHAVDTLSVKPNFYPACLASQRIGDLYVLVVGGTNSNLYVYSFKTSGDFEQCAVLAGHEDWIKSVAFVQEKPLEYVLASGSQDRYIRLWRLRLNEAIDDSDEDDSKLVLLSNKQYKFAFGQGRAAFSFEALIMGHDDWVTGLKWIPSSEKFRLLSLSADTALIVWEMDEESGIWVTTSRLGEMSIKGASTATGSSGGFWSCLWFQDKEQEYILTSGRTGAVRVYKSLGDNTWEALLGVTGAVQEVTDLVWSQDGTYVLSTSLDQTTRLIAPWVNHREETSEETWHEFARPQIHGYDMICADNLSPTRFVSGGDEKILRVFEMTQSINNLLAKFCGIESKKLALPDAASLPVLGLSNKAANEQMEAGEAQQREEDFEVGDEKKTEQTDLLQHLESPPLEDFLQRHTLFPEIEKLYGHGYEITCCATSPDQTLIASACRSNSAKHAVIKIFNALNDFQLAEKVLKGHNLTITSLEFSPDGKYLLAVSRDRQFSLWAVNGSDFTLVELNPKAHTRIIWDCSWAPNGFFVTGSRDKSLKLWEMKATPVLVDTLKTAEPITSVSCLQKDLDVVLVAVGHESGKVSIYKFGKKLEKVYDFPEGILPALRVSKLAFSTKTVGNTLQLAVGSTDSSVRIYYIEQSLAV